MEEIDKARSKRYTQEDLMQMDPEPLRALLHERVHHTIEVPLYHVLLKGQKNPVVGFGEGAQKVFDVWKKRGFREDAPDIRWVKEYLEIAEKIRSGGKVNLEVPIASSFTNDEMATVHKLIYERRSVRTWINKEVPDEMIEKILEAGRAAPIGCNLGELRFLVLKKPEEIQMLRKSDVPLKNCIVIVICHDTRLVKVVGQDRSVPQNAGFDAAAAADHMLLMIHALGLGGVWISEVKSDPNKPDSGEEFRKEYGLPDYIKVHLHIALGWPAIGSIKTERTPLKDMMLQRDV